MFKPLNGRVLIKPDKVGGERTTTSGIILVDKEDRPVTGTVLTPGRDVQEGERVLFSKYGFDEAQIDGEIHYVVSENLILGIF